MGRLEQDGGKVEVGSFEDFGKFTSQKCKYVALKQTVLNGKFGFFGFRKK